MTIRIELDVDRVALLEMRMEEDMHFPVEDVRKRPLTEDELREVLRRLLAGEFALAR